MALTLNTVNTNGMGFNPGKRKKDLEKEKDFEDQEEGSGCGRTICRNCCFENLQGYVGCLSFFLFSAAHAFKSGIFQPRVMTAMAVAESTRILITPHSHTQLCSKNIIALCHSGLTILPQYLDRILHSSYHAKKSNSINYTYFSETNFNFLNANGGHRSAGPGVEFWAAFYSTSDLASMKPVLYSLRCFIRNL
jgi:hypothetical protein